MNTNVKVETDVDAVAERALGFDLEAELELCEELAWHGGARRVSQAFDPARSHRLVQALVSTGRYRLMGELWREAVERQIDAGRLAPPEWN